MSPGAPGRRGWRWAAGILAVAIAAAPGCAGRQAPRPGPVLERGVASWYGPGFHGRRTANGEVFDQERLTAAHRTLPFDTILEVVNLDNGRRVTVRINDRGPFVKGRILDLSRAAARALDMLGPGTARVALRRLGGGGGDAPGGAGDPAPAGRLFAVQAGAFAEAARAAAFAASLRPRHPQVEVRSDGAWHRVVLAVFPTRTAAEALLERAESEGLEAFVVALEPPP